MATYWLDGNDLISAVKRQIDPAGTVLDIGCGIRPQSLIKPNVHVCGEPFDEYIRILKSVIENSRDRQYVIVKASWSEVVHLFPKNSIDTIFLLDVIEHVDKKEARTLLKETMSIAKQQIVVFTPLGFFPQSYSGGKKDAWGLNGGEWQESINRAGSQKILMIHGIFMQPRNFIERIRMVSH